LALLEWHDRIGVAVHDEDGHLHVADALARAEAVADQVARERREVRCRDIINTGERRLENERARRVVRSEAYCNAGAQREAVNDNVARLVIVGDEPIVAGARIEMEATLAGPAGRTGIAAIIDSEETRAAFSDAPPAAFPSLRTPAIAVEEEEDRLARFRHAIPGDEGFAIFGRHAVGFGIGKVRRDLFCVRVIDESVGTGYERDERQRDERQTNYGHTQPSSHGYTLAVRSNPATLRSSSISGQCMPCPAAAGSQLARCAGVAASKRGNHESGAAIRRPSRRCTSSPSSVTRTPATRSSSSAEMDTPCLQKCRRLGGNLSLNF